MEKKVKKGTAPPRYDEAFKAGAVRLVTEQGRQPREVAKELGICIDTLRSWLEAIQTHGGIFLVRRPVSRWGRPAGKTGNSGDSGNWKRKTGAWPNS